MLEQWLEQLGARIDGSIHDNKDIGGGECGYARIPSMGLRLRYSWTVVHIGWEHTFDRWANSVDWWCDEPGSLNHLRQILAEANRLGHAGELCDSRTDFIPRKIEL
jgi:hypothetical protein